MKHTNEHSKESNMEKADQIVNDLKVLRIKAKKDVEKSRNADIGKYDNIDKLEGVVSGLNIAIISAEQTAKRKE